MCTGAAAAAVSYGATDGLGGAAGAVEDFLHGRLRDPSTGEVVSDIYNTVSGIDVSHM
jgi:hypothetical protein